MRSSTLPIFLILFGFLNSGLSLAVDPVSPTESGVQPKPEQQRDIKTDHLKLISGIDNLTVEFTQEVYTSFRKKTKNRQGLAVFAKPNQFKWTFNDEAWGVEEYYFDGLTLSHFVKSENTVTHYGVQSGFAKELRQVVNMILDPNALLNSYTTQNVQQVDKEITYFLVPNAPHSEIKQIVIGMFESSTAVESVSIEYLDGNKSSYKFAKANKEVVSKNTFKFSNPGGVKEKSIG